jgi:thioredoxin reductase (NADPH)
MSANPDLLIVGAGPAGVSAALWAKSFGLSTLLLEAGPEPGGQLHQVHFRPENLPGAVSGHGAAIAAAFAADLSKYGIDCRCGAVAEALASSPAVRLAGGERLAASAVLIATGVRRRRLDVPGERELEGRGVSFSANKDRAGFAGEDMVVVGGGDSAFENALLLTAVGCSVTIVARGKPRARPEYRRRVAADSRIEVLEDTRVTAVLGEQRVRAVRLAGPRGDFELPVAGVVVKVGVIPNTEWCAEALELDGDGYIEVDDQLLTSQSHVWAAGDVARPAVAGITVAMGHGALAASAIRTALRGR